MINLPYIVMPDSYTRLLSSNLTNSVTINNNLEMYINENKELNVIIKKVFRDIDPDGFLGKIISIAGWTGIRNRLCCSFLEYSINGFFPDQVNVNLISDIVNLENKLRHFTIAGYSRAFLLGYYAKMTQIRLNQMEEVHQYSPLVIKEEHIDLMKYSKAKSIKIDWLILQLILFESFLGMDRLKSLLQSEIKFNALFNMLKDEEKELFLENLLKYGASISDYEFFLMDNGLGA